MNTTAIGAVGNVQEQTAQVFQFKQQQDVRAILIDGEPWFVAGDVAQALGYPEAAKMTRILDDDEKGLHIVETLGGAQEMLVINESGLYSAILRSRKPEAKAFKKWVTAEVLPAIRKYGMYLHTPALRPAMSKEHWREIYRKVDQLSGGWALSKDSKNWIFNHMRVVFSVPRFEDVPDDQFNTVMQLLAAKDEARWQFVQFVMEAREWFEKEVLGGGEPWTPAIKAKLTKQLKRQVILPPKTDWLALAKLVDDAAEGRAAA
ncbi:MAG: Bro-N domain-containing protein [Pseudomonadota bacterium]